ncbi:MAG TPA: guanylate kinase [Tenuifilaceae bacterium]|nr:guanylate kinase [Tenuifilaceae bacterium]HOZ15387.1 guanylate kinase [Tenuifilaceae bacterium]HPI44895.1 guanylate kinase [Tenuifilaceae bacterium]HPN22764.1 guanylate kinase [Tenuifilaceae bacterium]
MEGKLLIFSAPSGAGKTTIVKHLLSKYNTLEFSVSACSRAPRNGEVNGVDYHFLSVEDFRKRIANDEFVEWEEVYPGSYYGTLWSEVYSIWEKGHHVMFDVDVKGGVNLKKKFPSNSLAVFVMPPSIEELRARLIKRGTETDSSINVRIGKAQEEMEYANQFDVIIVNKQVETAFYEAEKAVETFINK